jgi:hypothetical protein
MSTVVTSWITGAASLSYIGGTELVGCGIMCHLMDEVIYGMEKQILY